MQNKSVFENLEVFIDRRACHLGVICNVGEVHDCAVTKSGNFKKTAESRDISGYTFGDYLLLKISSGIGLQVCPRILREIDRWKQASLESSEKIKLIPQFPVGERVEVLRSSPSSQQVDTTPAKFTAPCP